MKQTLTGIAILGLLVAAVQPRTNGGDDPRFADLYARTEASAEADELLLELTKNQERRIALLERQFEALPESIGAGLEEGWNRAHPLIRWEWCMADVEVLKTVEAVANAASRPGGHAEPVDWTEFAERRCGPEPNP